MLTGDRHHPVSNRVPARYFTARLDQLDARVQGQLEFGRSLIFYGATGRGKTYALAALCNADSGYRWIDWLELLDDAERAKKLRGDDARFFDPFSWLVRQPGMIYVDDVGAEAGGAGAERFAWLVNARYVENRGISFTTNLTPGKLSEYSGQRTMSRLVEISTAIVLEGDDRRLAAPAPPPRLPFHGSNVTPIRGANA